MKKLALALALGLVAALPAQASESPKDPARQTPWGLYLDAREAHAMKTGEKGQEVLLVDVRDPVEILFTGFTDVVDVVVPFMTVNRHQWQEKKPVFVLETNAEFEAAIARALAARNLTKDNPVILMCRSGGERGAPSARMLEGKGYKQVYVVTDGFEGEIVKEGERRNWRLVNGWKNSGLPWGYTLNKAKFPAE